MPACSSERRFYPSSPSPPRSNSASPPLSYSPLSSSPPQYSTFSSIKNSIDDLTNSKYPKLSEPSIIYKKNIKPIIINNNNAIKQSKNYDNNIKNKEIIINNNKKLKNKFLPTRIIIWYLNFLLFIITSIWNTIIFIIRAPIIWTSTWVCIMMVIIQLPLSLLKYLLALIYTPRSELNRNKRCVLISGGSTVQSIHLARNFYKAGARVIVCEIEGLFSLARYSIACSKFYTIPRPCQGNAAEYVKALKTIVENENAIYYIPVSSSNAAYYDALAKPHLEIIGCECFVPSIGDVSCLDDPLELLQRCRLLGLKTPLNTVLWSSEDITNLYDNGTLRTGRHVMLAAGQIGIRERSKIKLPINLQELNTLRHEISEKKPWIVIKYPTGTHYITCTTVKQSKVIANVTCRVDENIGLVPVINNNITKWLDIFFNNKFNDKKINGHLSFRFIENINNEIIIIGCRIGIGLPYVCLTSVHPRLIWRPCRHFSRTNSGPLVIVDDIKNNNGFPSAIEQVTKHYSNKKNCVIDKREELFVYWDPLPYCAYYHIQLPFNRLAGAIRAQPNQHTPPLAVVQ
ncbi:uncharacterized protein LOC122854875 [Aphidius gifuensis]|uniref:uncharacterized protein LOC122854875 n=1 Tax=Aphidius gifuensis TaxID=684658 RepID=UPI001CDC48DF|nr:uncharacterized protein LOC122854875 [Aphidius gifuensis]